MDSKLQEKCDLIVKNRELVGKAFLLESGMIYTVAALSYAEKGIAVDIDKIKKCQSLLKSKQGFFSELRGNNEIIVSTKMALSDDPEKYVDDLFTIYKKFQKGKIFDSPHRVAAAITICDTHNESQADSIIAKTNEILKGMNKAHPFLTSDDDTAYAVLLALTNKSTEDILEELQNSFQILKKDFVLNNNSVYTLCQALTIYGGNYEQKCQKAMEIYKTFAKKGHKYGKGSELAAIGFLTSINRNVDELVSEIIEVSEYLKTQKGFKTLDIGKETRLMIASMISTVAASKDFVQTDASILSETISLLITAEAALLVAFSAIALANVTTISK